MAYVIGDDCIACGTCIDECPAGAISEGDKYSINPDVLIFMWLKKWAVQMGSPLFFSVKQGGKFGNVREKA